MRVTAYDMMGEVVMTLHVDQSDGAGAGIESVLTVATEVHGVGESDEREWARDALIALVEAL